MMNKKYKHVYCTCCIHWNNLSKWEDNVQACIDIGETSVLNPPKICDSCYIDCPWDSRGNDLRINYKESLSGWWWLTKWEISDFFKYRIYKIRKFFIKNDFMRKKQKKYIRPEDWNIEKQLEYLGFETIPCKECSSKHYIGYHRKNVKNIKHSICPLEDKYMK